MKLINKLMKRLSLYLFLILFSLQTPSLADDIRDFQIEGMSIGDSLLDYFDKDLIEAEKYDPHSMMYKNNEYVQIGASQDKSYRLSIETNRYDDLSIVLKTNDITYKIYSVGGRIFCEDINVCKSKKKRLWLN